MAGEWPLVTVESIAEKAASGPFGSNLRGSEYVETGVPVIRGGNLSGSRFTDEGYVYVTDEKADSLSSSLAYPLDIIFAARGSVGAVGLVPQGRRDRYLLSSNLVKVTIDSEKADPRFVFYYFRSWHGQHEILSHVNTTGVPKIERALESLRSFRVPRPPLKEQQAIASILGALDDKIELDQRMNQTLEATAQAIFKSWFVDFEPVHAKAAGEEPPGLAPHIADLFPNAFEESELGEIPKGWGVGGIADMADVSSGKRPGTRYREPSAEAQVPLWGGNGPMAFVPEPLIDYPILLTGRVGTLGSVFRIVSPCWPSDNTLILRSKDAQAFEYLYCQLERIDFSSLNRGSTQPLLAQTDLKMQKLLVPSPELLACFHTIAEGIYRRIDTADNESRTLAALRDTLLPKLISGELRVAEAERIAGRHVR